MHLRLWFLALLFLCQVGFVADSMAGEPPAEPPAELPAELPTGPLAPQESLRHFRLDDGLATELVAHEPQVIDPVAMRFDERGRIWVVEMGDYPHGPPQGSQPQSRIRILDDQDQDGQFETSTIFADHLLFATGVQPWRDGAIVTLAGQVAFFRDRDGDGKSDEQEVWYTGFTEENSQLRANHPRLGLDGWIYVANGLRGGTVVDARRPEVPAVSISGRDFRFHPFSGDFEAVSGVGQFGLTFDDDGNRFICSNRNPLQHVVMEDSDLRKNPRYAMPAVVQDVARFGEQSAIYALTRAWTTSNLHAGQFTAACGVRIYNGDQLPTAYYGNGFTCDPTANLVHREVLQSRGGSFQSQSPYERRDFLASTDEWFRPVSLEVGPDGALYVVDMYRAVIEHPQFMPAELQQRADLRWGDDRGRIYRIVRKESKRARSALPVASTKSLEVDNGWARETTFRLLYQADGPLDAVALQSIIQNSQRTATRVAALALLTAKGQLTGEVLRTSLTSNDASVRRLALRVGGPLFGSDAELRRLAIGRASDDDARVRFQLALSLAPVRAEELGVLHTIAARGAEDVWTRRAVALAAGTHVGELVRQFMADPEWSKREPADAEVELARELLQIAFAESPLDEAKRLAAMLLEADGSRRFQLPGFLVAAPALARRGVALASLWETADSQRDWTALLDGLQEIALGSPPAVEGETESPTRLGALELLGWAPDRIQILKQLALSDGPGTVRQVAIAGFSRAATPDSWTALIDRFPRESPGIRRAIVEHTLGSAERSAKLLDRMESMAIHPGEMDRGQIDRLLKHSDESVRQRSVRLFEKLFSSDREQVLRDYEPVLRLANDPQNGREVFTKQCAACHRIGNLGVNVAPDISDSRVKTAAQLLTDILQPNRAIDNNYISYVVSTIDGQTLTGILTTETANSVTLKQAEGKITVLLRTEIETLRSTGVSLMPEGLEKNIPPQAMADLLGFIKNWRYLDGRTPLGSAPPR